LPSAPYADLGLLEEVSAATAGVSRLEMCIQCGTCGAPALHADMDHTPRQLFAMIRAGMREVVLRSNTPWFCVSCYHCVVRCPQEVHIADVMYTLKSMAVQAGLTDNATAADFSQTFVGFVEDYGRSFEFGLATRHYLSHFLPGCGMAPMGGGLLSHGCMDLGHGITASTSSRLSWRARVGLRMTKYLLSRLLDGSTASAYRLRWPSAPWG
jgi:heterodisulfide reductase subunit C